MTHMKPGRNQPCPCGSGAKFKHCCGTEGARGAAKRAELPANIFQQALAHHRAQQLAEAERLYRLILETVPENADVLQLLGVTVGQRGDSDQAVSLIRQAIKRRPRFAEAYNNLGNFLHSQGKLGEAASAFRAALDIKPAYPEAWNNLGNALRARQNESIQEAIRCYERAIELQPGYAEAFLNLGLAYQAQQRSAEAIACYRRALAIQPQLADAHHNLGLALSSLGENKEALLAYQAAIALRPNFAATHNNVGNVLRAESRLEDAIASYRRALALQPNYTEAHCNLALTLNEQNRFQEAVDQYGEALKIDSSYVEAHYGLGHILHERGRFAEAELAFREAIRLQPQYAEAYASLVRCETVTESDRPLIDQMESLLAASNGSSASNVVSLCMALGKAYDDLGEYDLAMTKVRHGNQLQAAHCPFDRDRHAEHIAALIGRYDRATLSVRPGHGQGYDSNLPILIVGMPRSGTTLVEQILSGHPMVGAGGELGFWADQEARIASDPSILPDEARGQMSARTYMEQLRDLCPGAQHVTDKLTTNFLRLGLIHYLLPKARIVHCRRDPLDTCLSIFFTRFVGKHCYSYDLETLTFYYEQYQRLMAHWRDVLPPDRFHEIDYERLVSRPEEVSRDLVAFCGLEWDPRCLEYSARQRAVRTASKWQVRQPIYTSSIGRWRHYESYLGPLMRLKP